MSNFEKIYSFDSTCSINGKIARPENYKDLINACNSNFIPRGAGTSYALASAGENITSVESKNFNRILKWVPEKEFIEIECGANLGHLLKFLAKKKFWFPVLPGHPNITIGGAIAFNVHGKSQHHHGLFGDHLLALKLYHPKFGIMDCSSSQNKDLFELTIGGMGLTGFIISAQLRVIPLVGNSIERKRKKCRNIFDAVEIMQANQNDYEYIYAWNDLNQRSSSFGAGWVYLERIKAHTGWSDIELPKTFNSLVYPSRSNLLDRFLKFGFSNHIGTLYKISEATKTSISNTPLFAGSFPIHGKEIYHRFFGKEGLLEYQLIIPWKELSPFMEKLQEILTKENLRFALGSLKIFKGTQRLLHFNGNGLCLSMDIPYNAKAVSLFTKIDSLAIQHNCLPNIAKDSRLSSSTIEKCYGQNYLDFVEKLNQWDKGQVVQSQLRQRLCL